MSWDGAWKSVSMNATVWGRVAVYSTLEELRRRMLVSELPIGPWHDEIATACRSEGGSSGYVGSGR